MFQTERNVLFNDALNTFYLQLYGIRHMIEDHSDSKGSFICSIPQTGKHIPEPLLQVLFLIPACAPRLV